MRESSGKMPEPTIQPDSLILSASKTLSILLAEDEPTSQRLLRIILKQYGCKVTVVSNGFHAYTLWEQESYDLILMDIQMPGIWGDEVVKKIRQQEQKQHTPIIAVTANTFDHGRKSLLNAGFDGYVAKPFMFEELVAEIEQVTNTHLLWCYDNGCRV